MCGRSARKGLLLTLAMFCSRKATSVEPPSGRDGKISTRPATLHRETAAKGEKYLILVMGPTHVVFRLKMSL